MFERRGGLRYLKLYRQARQRMLKRGQISYMEYAKSVAIQMVVALCPGFVRQFIFMKLLRKSNYKIVVNRKLDKKCYNNNINIQLF